MLSDHTLKPRFQGKIESLLPKAALEHKLFFFWCQAIDQNTEGALRLFNGHIKENLPQIINELSKLKQGG